MTTQLAAQARMVYGVPAVKSIGETIRFLESYGAELLPFHKHWTGFFDEYVNPELVSSILTIHDEQFIRNHATSEEKEMLQVDEPMDPKEFQRDPDDPEELWLMDFEIGAQRLLIVLEHDVNDEHRLGNFRIYGAGQWLRESLWAATGVVPLDPGTEEGELFCKAIEESRHH